MQGILPAREGQVSSIPEGKLAIKPNFFIVGAPKCGTTALYEYLRPHPHIFMPEIKEPHFFAKDLGSYPRIKRLEEYRDLFAGATEDQQRVGEASVYYLRSTLAIPKIKEFNPDARIIAMFRNPVDMVYSLHAQLLYVGEESEPDFETAWRMQERRRAGMDIPPRTRSPLLVQYEEVGKFGTQAQRVLASFPAPQVKFILYDDFAASPQGVYDEVIEFLGIPHDGKTEFPRINESKRARLDWLQRFSQKPPPALRKVFQSVKRAVGGGEHMAEAKKKIVALNTVTERRAPLSPAFRAELVDTFQDEVAVLGTILGRDLSRWI
jgi:Sulfotransferase domain